MKRKAALLITVIALASALWQNHEPAACRNLDFDYTHLSVSELTEVAAACDDEAMAKLYYNRAYYADLLASDASTGFDSRLSYLTQSHRLYMGMVEAFAPHWYPDKNARLAFLNGQYEQMAAIAELKLRQIKRLADRSRTPLPLPN